MNATNIFFSYARANSDFVLNLAKDLRAAGVDLWLDQLDIAPGERWDVAIQAALERATTLLIILSPESVASQNVMDEMSFALDKNKRVLPVLHRICEVPFRWRRLQHIDFTADYATGLARLLDVLLRDAASAPVSAFPSPQPAPSPPTQTPAPAAARGGINIGSMSGNATFSAGGDIVAGDKITQTTTTATTVTAGFKQEEEKQQFLQQIDALRAALREVQAKVQAAPDVDDDTKDDVGAAVLKQVSALKKTKDEAAALPVAAPPPPATRTSIAAALQSTVGVLDKAKDVCQRAVEIRNTAMPLIDSALRLFGSENAAT
jgi:TIR domain.